MVGQRIGLPIQLGISKGSSLIRRDHRVRLFGHSRFEALMNQSALRITDPGVVPLIEPGQFCRAIEVEIGDRQRRAFQALLQN
ncbi:hypothetical protein D3C78_1702570 [compost metagenome]